MPPQPLNHTYSQRTPTQGNGLHASISLAANSPIICLPLPFIIIPENSALEAVCSYCFIYGGDSTSAITLKRCTGCKVVRYCSKECQEAAWKVGGHRVECGVFTKLGDVGMATTLVRAAMRVMVMGGKGGETEAKWMHLEGHQDEMMRCERCGEILLQAKAASQYVSGWKERLEVVVGLLCRISLNAFRVTGVSGNPIGLLFDPLLALANHSCTPNAVLIFDGRTATLQALSTIEKGERILVSYIDPTQIRDARRKELKERWFFVCRCEKCELDDGPYQSYLKTKVQRRERHDLLLDFDEIRKTAEEKVRLIETDPTTKNNIETLAKNLPKLTTLLSEITSITVPSIRLPLLRSALSITGPLLSTLTAIPPFPTLLHDLYLHFLSLQLFAPALLTLLHLHLNADVYTYPQVHHPVRILRLYTIAKLAKVVAERMGVEDIKGVMDECGGWIYGLEGALCEVDWPSAVQAVLVLVREGMGEGRMDTRLRRLVEEEMRDVLEVQKLRGNVGEKIELWSRVGDKEVEGREYARRALQGLKDLAEYALVVIEQLVRKFN